MPQRIPILRVVAVDRRAMALERMEEEVMVVRQAMGHRVTVVERRLAAVGEHLSLRHREGEQRLEAQVRSESTRWRPMVSWILFVCRKRFVTM